MMQHRNNSILLTLTVFGIVFFGFQLWALFKPMEPMYERATHVVIALFILFIAHPIQWESRNLLAKALQALTLLGVTFCAYYYLSELPRLTTRIENVDVVEYIDIFASAVFVLLLLEAVRRTVGWMLVSVLVVFLGYGLFGGALPDPIGFGNIGLSDWAEIFTMTTSGVLGVTAATSVNFIFYFVFFGVVYSSVGGGSLFIDIAMRMVGRSKGGGAKVAIIGSSLMGTISGSAVANVTATGVFTIPLMKRTGMAPERAGAVEAIASTGGQLMPPVMGIAAFVMADLLNISYSRIALAGILPALAFYFSLFVLSDLHAKKHGVGTLSASDLSEVQPILPRLHLLLPPLVLIAGLVFGYSAQISVVFATLAALVAPLIAKSTRYPLIRLIEIIRDSCLQAAVIAAPIAAIGIVISVSIQTNLAMKFASAVLEMGGDGSVFTLLFVVVGCIIMGMGLPTVAAYIIGAILYAPAMQKLGYSELQSHFFVMYYCILSMVTPPVSLAAFAAAGIAKTDAMRTSLLAFSMSAVAFLIPFAFVIDEALLFEGSWNQSALVAGGVLLGTGVWAIGVVGYFRSGLSLIERVAIALCGAWLLLSPTGSQAWMVSLLLSGAYLCWHWWKSAISEGKRKV